jgi:predicted ATP-dependent serine protease
VRPIGGLERRLAEASRLGFHRAFASPRQGAQVPGLRHVAIAHVDELAASLAA